MNRGFEQYRAQLEEEKARLHAELSKIANEVDTEQGVWLPHASTLSVGQSDMNEVADAAEESEEYVALVATLGARYQNVLRALKKIDNGAYGTCEIAGEPIEADRLRANPAARTCKAHMEEEGRLA